MDGDEDRHLLDEPREEVQIGPGCGLATKGPGRLTQFIGVGTAIECHLKRPGEGLIIPYRHQPAQLAFPEQDANPFGAIRRDHPETGP